MICIIFYGTRLSGAVDYFTLDSETYFVHTMFFHCCFCPLGPRESFISNVKTPNTYLVRLPTTVGRSIAWSWLRILSIFLPLIFLVVGVGIKDLFDPDYTSEYGSTVQDDKKNTILMWFFIALALVSISVPILAFVYRPKASPEKKEEYTQMLANSFMASRCPQVVLPPASQIIVRTTTSYRPMNNEAPPPYVN